MAVSPKHMTSLEKIMLATVKKPFFTLITKDPDTFFHSQFQT